MSVNPPRTRKTDTDTVSGSSQKRITISGSASLNLKDKNVLVVGLALTGLAVARFVKDQGAKVTATDMKTEKELGSCVREAVNLGISLELGQHEIKSFTCSDFIVVSPGVPHTIRPLEAARDAGIPVIGEVELACRYINEPVVAITGTNGKTTTTSLIGKMLKASGISTFVGGNIGNPLIDYLNYGKHAEVIVAEISSFQLDTIETFRPKVGVLLNITEDHLDRYDDFHHYVRSKSRLFMNQEPPDMAVLNGMDPVVCELESDIAGQKLYFNCAKTNNYEKETMNGAMIQGKDMTCTIPGKPSITLNLAGFTLKGGHNIENAAAASLAALVAGADQKGIQTALESFSGLHHRLEYAGNVNGIEYYNDSKATNVDAVKRSLESFAKPVILIMGGRDKGGSYASLKELIKKRVKKLIAIGEAREIILSALGGLSNSQKAESLPEAVRMAHQAAITGDVVLLSPGCSSFDMFSDYAERGAQFCKSIERLG